MLQMMPSLRCLIVDDSPRFGEEARDVLEHEGISVVGIAASGDEAVRLARDFPDSTIVLNHTGVPEDDQLRGWDEAMVRVAALR